MRTTITIDDGLPAEAKARAAASSRTLNAVVDDARREAFARHARAPSPAAPPLPVFPGSRLVPGVDLDDSAALLEQRERAEP